jgi:NitT/TauT family transport system substrate-binding protein
VRRIGALVLAAVLALGMLAGCGPSEPEPGPGPGVDEPSDAAPMKIGVLPTEDSLPLWVAQDAGYFADAGLEDIEIVVFQSAQERDAAFVSGAIDAFMGDMIAAANLEAGGSPGTILTIMLGADPTQGRFAVLAPPGSKESSLAAFAGVPVGTSSATIQEYVLDGLMTEAGVAASDVKKEEVKKVPVRFELLMANKLKAAALPEPFVSLAEQGGAVVVADDTKSQRNLTQTILFVSDEFLREPGGTESGDAVLTAWDRAVSDVNEDPDRYRPVLVEQARLPEPLAETYKVNTYPESGLPAKTEVDAVLAWMMDKGYLKSDVTYEDLTLVVPED